MRTNLNGTDDLTVIAEGTRGADASRLVAEQRPDILVLDVNRPDARSSLQGTEWVRAVPHQLAA